MVLGTRFLVRSIWRK